MPTRKKSKRKRKNPAAVALGRKGGKAALTKLTAKQRKEKAKKAIAARWKRVKGEGYEPD